MTKGIPNTSGTLVAATSVKGAIVYNLTGEPLGNVDHVMIDTISGSAIYAVMSFGNFPPQGPEVSPRDRSSVGKHEIQLADGWLSG